MSNQIKRSDIVKWAKSIKQQAHSEESPDPTDRDVTLAIHVLMWEDCKDEVIEEYRNAFDTPSQAFKELKEFNG